MKECAYCGAVAKLTRDHVPPKGIFADPLPTNLITVPACPRCHSDQTSKDDEFFRVALQVRDGIDSHPEVIKARPRLLRALENPHKQGMRRALLQKIVLAEIVTPSGIFIKRNLAIETDMDRVRRVVARTVKGLFYRLKKHRLPDGYDALAFDEDSVQKWRAEVLDIYTEKVINPLLAQRAFTLGDGVFSFRFGADTADPNVTYWILVFYERAAFLVLTVPPDVPGAKGAPNEKLV